MLPNLLEDRVSPLVLQGILVFFGIAALLGLWEEGQPLVLVRSCLGLFSYAGRPCLSETEPGVAHIGVESEIHGGTPVLLVLGQNACQGG